MRYVVVAERHRVEFDLYGAAMAESWVLYPELRERMIRLVQSLDANDLVRTVPLTPGWTIEQVVAHLCGLNEDVIAGAVEGLGTDERTSAQVSKRSAMTVDEVCGEWRGYDEAMREVTAEVPLLEERLAADLVVHLHDVQHALGHSIDETDEATASAAHVYVTRIPDRWAAATGLHVAIELSDGYRLAADGVADLTLRATPYDFLRSVSGRRSRAQVDALDWSGDAAAVLDHFSPYAELGDTDAPV